MKPSIAGTMPRENVPEGLGFAEAQNETSDELLQVKDLLAGSGDTDLAHAAEELHEKLMTESFNLAVLGQFKRGKTTFINALLGAKVLPTAIVPLTSIVTIVKYGPVPTVTVVFDGGNTEAVSPDRLPDYVTESGNPNNVKGVRHVEVTYPSPYLQRGIAIIDTPGIGSTFAHNTATTYGFLSRVDAAVFMLSVDPPASDLEMRFLGEISKSADKFFFVLNKIDYVDEADMKHAISFNERILSEKLGKGRVRLFPVSARMALEAKADGDAALLERSGYAAFEGALERFLVEEKGKVFLLSVINRALRVIESRQMLIELEERARRMSLEALDGKIAAFDAGMSKITREKESSLHLIDWHLDNIARMIEADILALKSESKPRIIKELNDIAGCHPGIGNKELLGLVNKGMHDLVTETIDEWRLVEERKITAKYNDLAKEYYEKNADMARKIGQISSEVFSVQAGHFADTGELSPGSELFYRIDDILDDTLALDVILRSANLLLPSAVFRKRLAGKMDEKVMQLIDQNTGRAKYAFNETLLKAAGGLKQHQLSTIDSLIASMNEVVGRARSEKTQSMTEKDRRSAELAELQASLDARRKALERIRSTVLAMGSDSTEAGKA
jgi:GTPase SAR1 family protein